MLWCQPFRVLGKALREPREQAGLTQEALAARVEIGSTYVSQVENGHRGLRWRTLLAFLRAFDVDLRRLADAIDAQRSSGMGE